VTSWQIIAKNALRSRFRSALTVLGVAVAVITFVMLRTVLDAWSVGADYAAKDRLSTRNKVSFGLPLPKHYIADIAAKVPGIKRVSYCDWFGARLAKDPSVFFANLACADNAFEVYPEIAVEPTALAKWKADKQGAIIGDMLAKKLDLHVGDRVTLQGSFYPGDWEFTIDGIYTAPPKSAVDRSSFFFRWEYKNEGVPERQKNMIGWIFTRVDDPAQSAAVSRAIDALFESYDIQTSTMSERAANGSLLGGVSALLSALHVVSILVLAIMTLVLGNTIAMGVRERTTEYAVLRALGFSPGQIRWLIVGEAVSVSCVGGLLGLTLAFPLVQLGMGGWLEQNMGQYFPAFRIAPLTAASAQALTLVLGALAAWLPALRVGNLPVVEALRRVA
jgi:putative ABC transport system permease protein